MSSHRDHHFLKIKTLAPAALILALGLFFLLLLSWRTTPVLMYHSVSADINGTLSVTPENFARQMKFIRDKGFKVITLDQLVESIKEGKKYLPGTVAITFDDGLEDNFTNAFPVLSKYGMTATIFVVTGYIDRNGKYLTTDQILVMKKNGMTFGAHTRNGVYLPSLTDVETLTEEIGGSKKDLENILSEEVPFFCYSTGGFTEEIKDLVKKAGYKAAFTTNRGYDRTNRDLYEIKRVKVTNSDMTKPLHFRAKLSGFYNIFRSTRSGN